MLAIRIPAVVLGAALGAVMFLAAMRLPTRARLAALVALATGLCCLPLLVPVELAWVRLILCIPIASMVFKMWDLHASARTIAAGDEPDPRDVRSGLAFLLAAPTLLTFRRWRRRVSLAERPSLTGAVPHLAVAAAAGAGLVWAFLTDWRHLPFALEYVVKVPLLFLGLSGVTNAMIVLDRWRGLPVYPMLDRIWLAPTPADFWRRFDTPFHHFCREHLFFAWGGRAHPRAATLAIFAFSAIGHEILFTIVVGRVEGYQLAFFMIQGVVVATTLRFRPAPGWPRVLAHGATIAFVLVTGTIFFASVQSTMAFFVER